MLPLALWLKGHGASVRGSDDRLDEFARRLLVSHGIEVENLCGGPFNGFLAGEELIFSNAIPSSHPVREAAKSGGMRQWSRGEALAELAAGHKLFAVAGSHGKSSVSALIHRALARAEFPHEWLVGARFQDGSPPGGVAPTDSPRLIAELDESDGTINLFRPEVTVCMNLDHDHHAHYRSYRQLEETMVGLFERTRRAVIVSEGGAAHRLASGSCPEKLIIVAPPEAMAGAGFVEVNRRLAGAAAALLISAEESKIPEAPGLARRQELITGAEPVDEAAAVYDDYAHHPEEIRGFLSFLQGRHPGGKRRIVFQPHRFSRTRELADSFAAVLDDEDDLFLLPVYGAGEPADPAGGRDALLARLPRARSVDPGPGFLEALAATQDPGTSVFAFVGAGRGDVFARAFVEYRQQGGKVDPAWLNFVGSGLSPDGRAAREAPLARKTTLQLGGNARLYAEPGHLPDLRLLLDSALIFGIPWCVVGRGSNLIVPDEGFDGLVIRLAHRNWRHIRSLDGERLFVGAGARLGELSRRAMQSGLGGFEFLEGIPGTVGGALRMNAGAMGAWMFDLVESVEWLNPDGSQVTLPAESLQPGYRHVGGFPENAIYLGATLRVPGPVESADIRRILDTYADKRKQSQPLEPSAGCIFKNPQGDHAGRLIDASGLKGLRIGGAEVSTVHANFIINKGGARAADVFQLVRRVRAEVQDRQGILLEPEALLLGSEWEEVL
jgi:UDP-N-acetylenolpyruvoylglucosamine reductase